MIQGGRGRGRAGADRDASRPPPSLGVAEDLRRPASGEAPPGRMRLDAGMVAVVIVAFVGAASLIVAQRKIWPIIVQ